MLQEEVEIVLSENATPLILGSVYGPCYHAHE